MPIPTAMRLVTVWTTALAVAACASAPVVDEEPTPDPQPTGSLALVRDHALRPAVDDSGSVVALIAFDDATFEGTPAVLVHDVVAGTAVRGDVTAAGVASDASFISGTPVLSGDGTRVAHVSNATTLTPTSDPLRTVFIKDLVSGAVEAVTLADADGTSGCVDRPHLSRDGRHVLFNHHAACYTSSFASSSIYLKDLDAGTTARVSHAVSERSSVAAMNADASIVAFESEDNAAVDGDTNGAIDVFVRPVANGVLVRASRTHDGEQANAAVLLATQVLADDGRLVLLRSSASDLVPDDTNGFSDVFVFDRLAGTIERVSTTADGAQLDGGTFHARISSDGRFVVFATLARNLEPGLSASGVHRLYAKDLTTGAVARLDVPDGGDPDAGIWGPEFDVSGDGRVVVFVSANALTPGADVGSLAVYRVENPLWTP
jgi:Tol biopolymer transport system component